MNVFARVSALFFSLILAGCGTIIEATKSSLSEIKVSSPVARELGFREETHRVIIKNRLHLAATVFVNGDSKGIQIYPNGDLVFASIFEPFNASYVSVILVFHESDGEYGGYVSRVFDGSAFARSEAWTIFPGDVTKFGARLEESEDAPEFEPKVTTARLPREWFSGTGRLSVVNDTPGRLRVTTNGSLRTEDFAPGEIYTVRTRDFSASSRWGGRQPVIVQAEAWDDDGKYLGIFQREFYPPSYGSYSQTEAVSPSALRRR